MLALYVKILLPSLHIDCALLVSKLTYFETNKLQTLVHESHLSSPRFSITREAVIYYFCQSLLSS